MSTGEVGVVPSFDLAPRLVARALEGRTLNASGTRLLCVDGLAGAGKTTLALAVENAARHAGVSCAVVHLDDLYDGWTGLLTVETTILRDVLTPLRSGEPGRFRRFDWSRDAFAEQVTVPVTDLLVLEGCGSAPRTVAALAALVVFLTADDDLRLARGLARDGEGLRAQWRAFMRDERVLAAREGTREWADVVLDEVGRVLTWRPDDGERGKLEVGRWPEEGSGDD